MGEASSGKRPSNSLLEMAVEFDRATKQVFVCVSVCVSVCGREGERQTETETETDRERTGERERKRESEKDLPPAHGFLLSAGQLPPRDGCRVRPRHQTGVCVRACVCQCVCVCQAKELKSLKVVP